VAQEVRRVRGKISGVIAPAGYEAAWIPQFTDRNKVDLLKREAQRAIVSCPGAGESITMKQLMNKAGLYG